MKHIFIVFLCCTAFTVAVAKATDKKSWIVTMAAPTASVLESVVKEVRLTRNAKLEKVVSSLKSYSKRSQDQVIAYLTHAKESTSFSFESLWISNQIILRNVPAGDSLLLENLKTRSDVLSVIEDFAFHLDKTEMMSTDPVQRVNGVKSWGIAKVGAPEVWGKGFNGSGVLIATVDSGAQGNHEALVKNFVGLENFGWFDPSENTDEPTDFGGHGTHVHGTITGFFQDADGQKTEIGVAPGAKWMSCKGCGGDGYCWVSNVVSCYQFLLCPKGSNSDDCDPKKAPHVVNNSYFIDYVDRTGTRSDPVVEAALDALHAAGVMMVFAIGNNGRCNSAGYPGDYEKVFAVGSTTSTDDLSYFSSSGPGTAHGLDVIKPEATVPGSSITSSIIGTGHGYGIKSGTSMASPHATGIVALMLSKNPELTIDEIREILIQSTESMVMSETRNCGGVPDTTFPNFSLGFGRLNADNAIDQVPEL